MAQNKNDSSVSNKIVQSNNSSSSEGDNSGDGNLEVKISGEADGMQMYMRCLPFLNIELKTFQLAIENLKNQNSQLTLDNLRQEFQTDSQWKQDESPNI